MSIEIRGATVLDPFHRKMEKKDIYIEDGVIVKGLSQKAMYQIEAAGLYLAPAFIDAHTHLRDPGQTYKEDIISGTKAAARGGYAAVAAMPNTDPVCDAPEIVSYILEKSEQAGFAQVLPVAAVTIGLQGSHLSDFQALKQAGAVALSDDGKPIASAHLLYDALKAAHEVGLPLIDHPEETGLSHNCAMTAGQVAASLGVRGMPNTAESIAVARDILVAEDTGLPIHLCHISTKQSVDLIRAAKARGIPVSADACPHHFILTDEAVRHSGSNAKMYPPLRSEQDRQAVLEGLLDGTIDLIATDHAPHSPEEKAQGLEQAPSGIVGLETAFALSYTKLCREQGMELMSLLKLFTTQPAKLLQLSGRDLQVGNAAHLCLFSLGERAMINADEFYSKSRNTPFDGFEVYANIEYTIWKGNITYAKELC